jgi:very-short-patch-repair endonuclease
MVRFRDRPTRRAQELRQNATDAEKRLWLYLRNRQLDGHKFSRQMPVGPFICDFMCREARLIVELDGGQHDAAAGRDAERTRFIESEGYRVIRFWNNDVLGNVDGVLSEILRVLAGSPTPSPSRKREGNA